MLPRILIIVKVVFVFWYIFWNSRGSACALNLQPTSLNPLTNNEFHEDTRKNSNDILVYRNHDIRVDVRLISGVHYLDKEEENDQFPVPPIEELVQCMVNVSSVCIRIVIAEYIDAIGRLDKVILFGRTVKFVKVRELLGRSSSRRIMNLVGDIDRSIDDFFDKFALRITLAQWDGRNQESQIDFMFDDNNSVEGRKKGDAGGGKGDKCKQMMMCIMIALKMNMMGMMILMMMKGVMMSGIFLIMTKALLIMKFIDSKRNSNTGDQIKKIIVLTKGSGSSDCRSCHGPPQYSSYGGLPSSPS